jgi:hypothetical protein
MIVRRTSIKALAAAFVFGLLYLVASRLAEHYYLGTDHIYFGADFGRPWNPWDVVAYGSLILSIPLVIVCLLFLQKHD